MSRHDTRRRVAGAALFAAACAISWVAPGPDAAVAPGVGAVVALLTFAMACIGVVLLFDGFHGARRDASARPARPDRGRQH